MQAKQEYSAHAGKNLIYPHVGIKDMQIVRTINVLTLTALLLLTGCYGLTPPAEAEETTDDEVNNAPSVLVSETLNELALENGAEPNYGFLSGDLIGFEIQVYHAAVDVDGDVLTMGWDLDLDGQIDVATTQASGFTSLDLPLSILNELDAFGYGGYYHAALAFIAIDEHGLADTAITEVFMWDPEGREDDGNTDGNLALYAFSGEDAQGSPSTGTDDNLIMLTMDQGGDINWASVSVKLSIDGGSPVFCDNPGGDGGVCVLVDNGRDTNDQFWSVGESVTIVETGADLCNKPCTIDVTITDTREEKVIDTTNGVPAE